jgi:hypothetical protein
MNSTNGPGRREVILQGLFLIGFLAVIVLALNALGIFRRKEPGIRRITYRVEGSTATGVITYTLESGESTDRLDIAVPWKSQIMKFDPGTMIILTAGNPGQVGDIRCTIVVDGKTWKSEKATIPQDKVACAGILP